MIEKCCCSKWKQSGISYNLRNRTKWEKGRNFLSFNHSSVAQWLWCSRNSHRGCCTVKRPNICALLQIFQSCPVGRFWPPGLTFETPALDSGTASLPRFKGERGGLTTLMWWGEEGSGGLTGTKYITCFKCRHNTITQNIFSVFTSIKSSIWPYKSTEKAVNLLDTLTTPTS